jgi:hypothetical protein
MGAHCKIGLAQPTCDFLKKRKISADGSNHGWPNSLRTLIANNTFLMMWLFFIYPTLLNTLTYMCITPLRENK